jgi:hypothetical protein
LRHPRIRRRLGAGPQFGTDALFPKPARKWLA